MLADVGNNETTWRVDVTDDDIRGAKRAWVDARERGDADDAVAARFDTYRQLVSGQAQQIADDFRARRAG